MQNNKGDGFLMDKATLDNQNRIKELEEAIKHHGDRLHQLEEKERARARDEHARNEHLDFLDSEGLGKQ